MIKTSWGRPERDAPAQRSDDSGEPAFGVRFSRPESRFGLSEAAANSFRWTGAGVLQVQERGIVVTARRRYLIGLHRTESRFVPRAEIAEAYREGDSVRVQLRGRTPPNSYFVFWAESSRVAATIVRLLPTTRTVDVQEARTAATELRAEAGDRKAVGSWRTWAALIPLLGATSWIAVDVTDFYRSRQDVGHKANTVRSTSAAQSAAPSVPAQRKAFERMNNAEQSQRDAVQALKPFSQDRSSPAR